MVTSHTIPLMVKEFLQPLLFALHVAALYLAKFVCFAWMKLFRVQSCRLTNLFIYPPEMLVSPC